LSKQNAKRLPDERNVPDLSAVETAMNPGICVAAILLCAGMFSSSARAESGVAKPGLIHAHNLAFEKCPPPVYPERERERNHQGTVKLRFFLGADGTVGRTLVEASSAYPALDEAARAAVAGCRFAPPMIDGQSVEGWTTTQYSFQTPASGYSAFLPLVPVFVGVLFAFRSACSYSRCRSSRLST